MMKRLFLHIKQLVLDTVKFFTYDIWHINSRDRSVKRIGLYNVLKSFILAIQNIRGERLSMRAGALTYSTLLSIVPILAVLFAIARGFGFQNIVESELFRYFSGQEELLKEVMVMIDNSLQYANGGIFLGVGIVLLLWTVFGLFQKIETNFNEIWQIQRQRSNVRRFTDYLALLIITPIFLVCNAGVSIWLNSIAGHELYLFTPFVTFLVHSLPWLITILLFVFFYMYVPNTKVKFGSALFAGILAGVAFQLFQLIYISGQLWISKYNAIYGSFAALLLFLLWMQYSWFIWLFGAELAFAHQNVSRFDFEQETRFISQRERDFALLIIMRLIVRRFAEGKSPYSADAIAEEFRIPTRLTTDTLGMLMRAGLIRETPADETGMVVAYLPASDIGQLSVARFFERIDSCDELLHARRKRSGLLKRRREPTQKGDFWENAKREFVAEWQMIERIRERETRENPQLIKDL